MRGEKNKSVDLTVLKCMLKLRKEDAIWLVKQSRNTQPVYLSKWWIRKKELLLLSSLLPLLVVLQNCILFHQLQYAITQKFQLVSPEIDATSVALICPHCSRYGESSSFFSACSTKTSLLMAGLIFFCIAGGLTRYGITTSEIHKLETYPPSYINSHIYSPSHGSFCVASLP